MTGNVYHILFVCSGNSCRSPIAEGMLREKLPANLRNRVVVESAGTMGLFGNPATPSAIFVARERGVDISIHESQGLTREVVESADLIFCMSQEHVDFILEYFPDAAQKVHLLKMYNVEESESVYQDIDDPIGGSIAVYRECATVIDDELERILPDLLALIEEHINKQWN